MPTQMPSTGRPAADAVADRLVEPVDREAPGSALDVPDTGDHRERRVAHLGRVDRDRRLGTCPREGRGDRAEIAGAVVGEHDPHAIPFVERMPPSPAATACRSACPSALKAASAMWWSSVPADSTWTVQPASIVNRSSA